MDAAGAYYRPFNDRRTRRVVTRSYRRQLTLARRTRPCYEFGPMPIAAITRHDVQTWVNTLARDNLGAPAIGDIYRGVFKAVLNKAIPDGRLAVSAVLPYRAAAASGRVGGAAGAGAGPGGDRRAACALPGDGGDRRRCRSRGSARPPGSRSAVCAPTRSGCGSTGSCSRPAAVPARSRAGAGTREQALAAARCGAVAIGRRAR